MSDLSDAGRMLEAAEQAAAVDDLVSADELLRGAARIQEAELGPLHPDLANTLNNLAVVAEKSGRLGDAETCYRRAVAIASASLPDGHPMIAASRENLEAFCRARGVPIDRPELMIPAAPEVPSQVNAPAPAAADVRAVDSALAMGARSPMPESSWPAPPPGDRTAPETHTPVPRRLSRSLAPAAIGVAVVFVTVVFLVRRPWSSPETLTPAPSAEPARSPQAAEPARPTGAERTMPAPTTPARPASVPRAEDRDTSTSKPSAPPSSAGVVALTTVQLCRKLSTSGASWECDPVVDPVSPAPLVLYTRVRSTVEAVVVHRWYRGDVLRQSVKLTVHANATEGYRTYSRQTVDGGAGWRVEVRSAEGVLLYERRFAVQ
ncbi:MAG TPA: DUF2914 domain-containing protein [Vicinamibacterales bacterium]